MCMGTLFPAPNVRHFILEYLNDTLGTDCEVLRAQLLRVLRYGRHEVVRTEISGAYFSAIAVKELNGHV